MVADTIFTPLEGLPMKDINFADVRKRLFHLWKFVTKGWIHIAEIETESIKEMRARMGCELHPLETIMQNQITYRRLRGVSSPLGSPPPLPGNRFVSCMVEMHFKCSPRPFSFSLRARRAFPFPL